MKETEKIYNSLPDYVKTILINGNGILIGGSIRNILEDQPVKDYDIIIPNREDFLNVIRTLQLDNAEDMYFNTFGGVKLIRQHSSYDIDVWCEELSHFLSTSSKTDYIYILKRELLFKLI